MSANSEPRIAWLFKEGRRARLEAARSAGAPYPREFFYGFTEMSDAGLPATLIEEGELGGGGGDGWVPRAATVLTFAAAGINAGFLARCLRQDSLARLNRFDVLVATTNNQGRTLALLRGLGRLRARVLNLAMGALPLDASPLRRVVSRRLMREITLAPISRGEEGFLRSRLDPKQDMAYLPFGVDHRFWTPGPNEGEAEDYVLSIGNDPRRDYETLVAAWRPEFPPLKIVTRLPVTAPAPNIEVVAGDWNRQFLSDADVRTLIRNARFVVLPLHPTIQPSGQSACLQAMACGKAVILSDTPGLWNRQVMVDGETCILVAPGAAEDLGAAVDGLLTAPRRAGAIGGKGRAAVDGHFNLEIMATAVKSRIEALL